MFEWNSSSTATIFWIKNQSEISLFLSEFASYIYKLLDPTLFRVFTIHIFAYQYSCGGGDWYAPGTLNLLLWPVLSNNKAKHIFFSSNSWQGGGLARAF